MPLFASHLAQIDQWTELQRQKEIPESTVARTYSFLFAFPSHPRFPLTSSSSNSQIFPSQRSQAKDSSQAKQASYFSSVSHSRQTIKHSIEAKEEG